MARSSIRDVAEAAGVAVGTVSRVLNASGPVRRETAERVREAMRRLDYQPNAAGRTLRSGATRALGILVPTLTNPIFARSVEGIEDVAAARRFATIITASRYDPAREKSAIAALLARGVEGMVLTLSDASGGGLSWIAEAGVPFVLLYNPVVDDTVAVATVDSRGAMAEATRELIARGHRRIAFLAGAFASSDRSRARYEGYRSAMEAVGLPVWSPVEVDFTADTAAFEAALAALLARLNAPTALIASNDLLGLHAIAAARRLGLCVPQDISVVGFDGLPMARIVEPQLATVQQPARRMGEAAATILFDMIAGAPPRQEIMAHTFLPGGSLAAAPESVGPMRAGPASRNPHTDI